MIERLRGQTLFEREGYVPSAFHCALPARLAGACNTLIHRYMPKGSSVMLEVCAYRGENKQFRSKSNDSEINRFHEVILR